MTDNIGDGRVWTLTVNGGVRVTPELRFEAGVALNDGEITSPTDAFIGLIGRELRWQFDGNSEYRAGHRARSGRLEQAARRRLALEANAYARFVGRSRLGIGPHLGDEPGRISGFRTDPAHSLGDRRAISLTVTNLTDEIGNRFAFGAPIATGADQITPLRPRTIRLGFEQPF